MTAFGLGASAFFSSRRPRFWLGSLAAAVSFVSLVALLERSNSNTGAVDRALLGAVFGWVLPLFGLFLVRLLRDPEGLEGPLSALARSGRNRRQLTLGALLGMTAALAGVGVSCAWATLAVGYDGPHSSTFLADGLTTSWIAALGALAYIGWFSLWSRFAWHASLWVGLAVDLALGSSRGILGLLTPRAQLSNLLGGLPVLDLSQPTSTLILLGLSVLTLSFVLFCVEP
jgi:hypothetical protein